MMHEVEILLDQIIDNERQDIIDALMDVQREYPDAFEFLQEKVSEII